MIKLIVFAVLVVALAAGCNNEGGSLTAVAVPKPDGAPDVANNARQHARGELAPVDTTIVGVARIHIMETPHGWEKRGDEKDAFIVTVISGVPDTTYVLTVLCPGGPEVFDIFTNGGGTGKLQINQPQDPLPCGVLDVADLEGVALQIALDGALQFTGAVPAFE